MQTTLPNSSPATTQGFIPLRQSLWWTWALRGLIAIVFGVLAFIWPVATIGSLIFVVGIYAILDGVFAFIEAIKRRKTDSRWWALLLESLVSLLLGTGALLNPGLATVAFVYMLGFWAIVTGLLEIVQAVRARNETKGEGWLIVGGLLSVAFGVTLIMWPISGAITLVWLLGGYAIGFGFVMLIVAFKLRNFRAPAGTVL